MDFNIFKRNPFTPPSADVLAAMELEEARRQLLAAYSQLEHAEAVVAYNTKRVSRLQNRRKDSQE